MKPLGNMASAYKRGLEGKSAPRWAPKSSLSYKSWLKGKEDRVEKVLHLTLKKIWFDAILSGEKKVENREIKGYWSKRLEEQKYDYIHFVNGYGKDKPWMDVKMKGIVKDRGEGLYKIHLGEILRKGNIQ